MADNPALRREWGLQAKQRTPFQEALAWLGLVGLLVAYAAAAWWLSRPGRDPWSARALVFALCTLYLLLITVLVPGPTAFSVAGERERGVWQELLLTHLRPSQLAAAKLMTCLRLPATLLAALLPLLGMGLAAGQMAPGKAVAMVLILVSAPLATVTFALWVSARSRRTMGAATLAYLVTGLVFWGCLTPATPLQVRGENLWWYASPVWHCALLCLGEPQRSPLAVPLLPEWLWAVLAYAGLSALFLCLLTRRIAADVEKGR